MKQTGIIASLLMAALTAGCGSKQEGETAKDAARNDSTMLIAVGSYSSPEDEGISLMRFDTRTGTFSRFGGVKGVSNPSYLVPSADGRLIYAVGEDAGLSSTINVIRREQGDSLALVGSVPTFGGAPCYINLSPDGRYVLTANYLGGNVTIYRLDGDGMPTGKPQVLEFAKGKSSTQSEEEPRLHSVTFTPDSKLLLAADLGTDRVHVFPLNASADSTLVDPAKMKDVTLTDNSGPRHIVYKGDKAYVINEISGEATVMQREGDTFRPIQYIASDSVGGHGSGDIHFSPDGRFLYTSNRLKADGVAIFRVREDGRLVRKGYLDTGAHPRNFMVLDDWLIVASRDENRIEVYSRDSESGLPLPVPASIMPVSKPVCLKQL